MKTIASPFCRWEGTCPRGGGRAVLGPARKFADCVNRTIRCLTCGVTGEESLTTVDTTVGRKPYKLLKINKRRRA